MQPLASMQRCPHPPPSSLDMSRNTIFSCICPVSHVAGFASQGGYYGGGQRAYAEATYAEPGAVPERHQGNRTPFLYPRFNTRFYMATHRKLARRCHSIMNVAKKESKYAYHVLSTLVTLWCTPAPSRSLTPMNRNHSAVTPSILWTQTNSHQNVLYDTHRSSCQNCLRREAGRCSTSSTQSSLTSPGAVRVWKTSSQRKRPLPPRTWTTLDM